ncbi:MAG: PEGA domain-containing protein, partial [Myxococcales bacterium]|nr:PEGA domain-containing protein [Myxococcales bacterium]
SGSSDEEAPLYDENTYRRAPGPEADPDRAVQYGRLIVMEGQSDVRVSIEGEPYPMGSLSGVILWAGYQYDVLLEAPPTGTAAAASSGAASRIVTIRLEPNETRILLASVSEDGGSVAPRTSSSRTSSRSTPRERDEDEDEDEDIGYLGVSSTPRGVVYIDGDNTGQTTPARRIELEPGRHEVRIFYESEEQFSETKNVLIRSGVNTNVFFRYRPDED